MTVYEMVRSSAQSAPQAAALSAPGRAPMSYGRLLTQVLYTRRRLQEAGIGRGDQVAIALPNGPELACVFLGVASTAAAVPLNPESKTDELMRFLSRLRLGAVIAPENGSGAAAHAAQMLGVQILRLRNADDQPAGSFALLGGGSRAVDSEPPSPADIGLLMQTSGTTGTSKIVPLSQQNIVFSCRNMAACLRLVPGDRCLNVMPLFHLHGLLGAVGASIAAGAEVVCTPGFYITEFFHWLRSLQPTWYTAVPTMHQSIIARLSSGRETADRHTLRMIRSTSSALPAQVMIELEKHFGVPVIEAYATVESSQVTSNPLPPGRRRPGSVGFPAGARLGIRGGQGDLLPPLQRGEVVIRGEGVIGGYYENPEANASSFTGGWFRTGDEGYVDEEGYVYITGRLKEIINRAGETIAPREIDDVLLEHSAVAEAVAFGVPDPRLGEEVFAAVVLRENRGATEAELQRFLSERVADFKVPKRFLFVDRLPKGATGKVQRMKMAELLGIQGANLPQEQLTARATDEALEKQVADIWSQVLKLPVAVQDSFLQLGGDSMLAALILTRIRDRYDVDLSLVEFFNAPTAGGMAALLESRRTTAPRPRAALPRAANSPTLSFSQKRLWFLDQLQPGSAAYNSPVVIQLLGDLQADALKAALGRIFRRHEVLRSTFPSNNGEPSVRVMEDVALDFPVSDLRKASDPRDEARQAVQKETAEAFNLSGPLFRGFLLRVEDHEHWLVLVFHHMVFDGQSREILIRELSAGYEAAVRGETPALPELRAQFADFAAWQSANYEAGKYAGQVNYWTAQLSNLPTLDLPTSRRMQGPSRLGRVPFAIDRELEGAARNVAAGNDATAFMLLLAAYGLLLSYHSRQDDLAIGSPVNGRNLAETENLIGFFINTVVLRMRLSGDPDFQEVLRRVRQTVVDALSNQEVPFEKVVEALNPRRTVDELPLFRAWFVLQKPAPETVVSSGLHIKHMPANYDSARFLLKMELTENGEGMNGRLEYRQELFDHETIFEMKENFLALLAEAVHAPEIPISRLFATLDREKQERLATKRAGSITENTNRLKKTRRTSVFE